MSDTVIKIENVSKIYRLGEVGTGSLAHDINRWWHKIRGKENPYLKFGDVNDRASATGGDYAWALKDISFEVKRGEVLGIIGRNGAGKSTLLKILSRVTQQTEGRIKVRGRIASLLEVGTGFHPELTGRENIFLNGAILGMRKAEIARKFDEIVEFSGCARYIDTPVKRYSSGMYVRLAFAVAAHLEPEILIVDEVLAVGDAEFQKKCLGKMKDVAGEGRTVLFVTHQLSFITSISKNCIWMDSGTVKAQGPTIPIVQEYINTGNIGRSFERERLTDSRATLTKGSYFAENNIGLTRMIFSFEIDAAESVSASLDFRIKDAMLREVGFGSLGVFDSKELLDITPGKNQIQVAIDTGNLASGIYTLSVDLSIPEKAYLDRVENAMTFEVARPNTAGHSRILQQAWGYGCWHVNLEKVAL